MMKSGLSQNEKLKALRIFVDDYDYNNSELREIARIEKHINILKRSGLKTPYQLLTMDDSVSEQKLQESHARHYHRRQIEDNRARQRHKLLLEGNHLLEGPPDYYLPYAKHIDAMRVAVGYTGNPKCINDAKLKHYYLKKALFYWQEGDSVLCLTDDDINEHSGCFMFNDTSIFEYWVYQGREQTGDYIFKYTADYYRHGLSYALEDGEYFKRMSPAEAMNLKRRPFDCRYCKDIYTHGDWWGDYDQCLICDPVCRRCNVDGCVCDYND
jgi:hypothetical protein